MTPIAVLNEQQYFDDVVARLSAAGAGDRVAMATMSFNHTEKNVMQVMAALEVAAARGASVDLVVDAFALMTGPHGLPTGPLFTGQGMAACKQPYFRELVASLEKLKTAGGRYTVINRPARPLTNPMAGRSHIKATVINDILYVGGCNLEGSGLIDLMARLPDKRAADWAYALVTNIAKHGHSGEALGHLDRTFTVDDRTSLVVDSGERNRSLIFEQALRVIDEAREWLVLTCQFFPYGITAKHLAAASRRGVKVHVFYNHPSNQSPGSRLAHHLVVLCERARCPKALFACQLPRTHRRIHSKLVANEKEAILGSHNLVTAGIRLGTAEIVLDRHDPGFALAAIATARQDLPDFDL